jgi:hypothetical protein
MGLGLIGEVVRGDRDVVSALFGKVELETTVWSQLFDCVAHWLSVDLNLDMWHANVIGEWHLFYERLVVAGRRHDVNDRRRIVAQFFSESQSNSSELSGFWRECIRTSTGSLNRFELYHVISFSYNEEFPN